MNDNVCQSTLKQQCQDESGLYDWIRKEYKLFISTGIIEIKDFGPDSTSTSVSIFGAKHAKEWSYSSSLAGYGFDLIWTSGKIWSFLVDEEMLCKKWVASFNASITQVNAFSPSLPLPPTPPIDNHAPTRTIKKPPFHISDSIDNLQALRDMERHEHRNHSLNHRYAPNNYDMDDTHIDAYSPPHQQQHQQHGYVSRDITPHSHENQRHGDEHERQHLIPQHLSHPLTNTIHHHEHDYNRNDTPYRPSHGANADVDAAEVHQSASSDSAHQQTGTYSQTHLARIAITSHPQNQHHDSESYRTSNAHTQQASIPSDTLNNQQYHQPPVVNSPPTSLQHHNMTHAVPLRDTASAIESELHNSLLRERSRCQQLERSIESKDLETSLAHQQLDNLQQEMLLRVTELQRQLDQAKEKERSAEQDVKNDVESRVMRACNDNNSFYEASSQAARIQHQRELTCLREELLAERKRHSELLDKERLLRRQAEQTEQMLKSELTGLQDKMTGLQMEHTHCRDTHASEAKAWDRERLRIQSEHVTQLKVLEKEKTDMQLQARQELQNRVAELKVKYDSSLRDISTSNQASQRQEFEGELLRQSNEMQKRCQREIEAVRTEERKIAANELTALRAAFLKREHNTSEDLLQLERLHASRVSQLEEQCECLKNNNKRLTEELHTASLLVDKGSESSQHKALHFQRQMEEHNNRADLMQRQLEAVHSELLQTQSREASYRSQLGRALEETRVKSAELVTARQQASVGSVQAQQWHKVSQESDLSVAAAHGALEIAREEVSMLEFELQRMRDENSGLKQELLRADKIIFGVAQHQPTQPPRTQRTEIENAKPRNVAQPTVAARGKYPIAQQHNSVIYSTPSKSKVGNSGMKSTPTSAAHNNTRSKGGVLSSTPNRDTATGGVRINDIYSSPFAYRTVASVGKRTTSPSYSRTQRLS